MPLVFARDQINQLALSMDFDFETLDDLVTEVRQSALVYETAYLRHQTIDEFETSPHIEAQIYEDFDAFDRDRYLMEDFHNAPAEEKTSIARQFSDQRFRAFCETHNF